MFRKNSDHRQASLLGFLSDLPARKAEKLRNSWAGAFYELVFSQIDEGRFAVLFDDGNGRPNAAVNCQVSAVILQEYFGWSCEELFDHVDFDLQTRFSVGLSELSSTPFSPSTYFLFRKRLLAHWVDTGENLLEGVFDSLTEDQLKRLELSTSIQRSDSFQAVSNIFVYTRVQLLVEMLLRLQRIVPDALREQLHELFRPYAGKSSGQYVHHLKRRDLPHELSKLAAVYHRLHTQLQDILGEHDEFQRFERVYREHFTMVEGNVSVRPDKEIDSRALQSPDDPDATFHRKSHRSYRGQVVNVTETADPDNDTQLITDISVNPNADSDSAVLHERLPEIKDKTPDLEELHTDGNYASTDNDELMEQLGVTHIMSGGKGREAKVPIEIDQMGPQLYQVRCPRQMVLSLPTSPERYKARFVPEVCTVCDLCENCPCIRRKDGSRAFYFDHSACRVSMRARSILNVPPERRKLRANVEATVKQFTRGFNHKGKLKRRGRFSAMLYAFSTAIGINAARVWSALNEPAGPRPPPQPLSEPLLSARQAPHSTDSTHTVTSSGLWTDERNSCRGALTLLAQRLQALLREQPRPTHVLGTT